MKNFGTIKMILIALILSVLSALPGQTEINLLKNDALIEAAKAGDLRVGQDLLHRKHNIEGREQDGRTPLFFAASRGSEDFVELLVKHNAKIDALDNLGNSPIYYAAAGNHVGVVEILLESGANLDSQNRRGLTPLMIAASEGNLSTVQVLIDGKADPTLTDFTGRTAWEWAHRSNHRGILRYMRSVGINR
ncbi:MAG: hypothetical protein CFH41_01373 [Alphaproteobacteria bacterium MarineAlpha11_Bin1]|nr:MAG: hypothetical protein CFH41_01373 [Alphaproteobacteria bacterium MarineAlpha11_Bin1]|tara:strand:- start:16647 stop:17219 length:573 start_codon:yes stop_codon:yes gene_type:complete